jgi:hypothetical protein
MKYIICFHELLKQNFAFIPAPVCATWAFDIPNGAKTCSGLACTATCKSGSYFMEAPGTNSIGMTCNSQGWSREPPVCGKYIFLYFNGFL